PYRAASPYWVDARDGELLAVTPTRIAATTLDAASATRLMVNEPVWSRSEPIRYGPKKPLRLPTELMSATAPAAATPVRNIVGKVQKIAIADHEPRMTKASPVSASAAETVLALSNTPSATKRQAAMMCQVRSPVRSEWRVQNCSPTTATAFGAISAQPTCALVSPNCLIIRGIHIPIPARLRIMQK